MSDFLDGWKAFAGIAGVNAASFGGAAYVGTVDTDIKELERGINGELRHTLSGAVKQTDINFLKGDAAEYWHALTHNIDAAVKDSKARAEVARSHVLGSPDVKGNWKDGDYGLKYMKEAEASAQAQAEIYRNKYEKYAKSQLDKTGIKPSPEDYFKSEYEKYLKECEKNGKTPESIDKVFPGKDDLNNPLYSGQMRLIPKEQLKEAEKYLKQMIAKEANGGRPEQVKRYEDALKKLTDRIKSSDGAESIPLSEEEAKELAKLAKEGKFDPATWGLTTEELIKWEYIMEQAYKAGLSAAVISVVLEVAPVLISMISELIRDGEVDSDKFKKLGFASLKGGSLGFVRGTVASAITIACAAGKFGEALKGAKPTVIGAVVALTMNTLQNATLMAFGRISNREFANICIRDLTVTCCSLALGSAIQALLPELPVLGYMLGSFIGSVIGSFVYNVGYNCVISFCVDTGCTFFGLVKQDYTLPKEVLINMGLDVFEYEKFIPKRLTFKKFEPKRFTPQKFEPQKIGITFLRRGVIGVNCIGYM